MSDVPIVFTDEKRLDGVCGADESWEMAASDHLRGEADLYLNASTVAASLKAIRWESRRDQGSRAAI